MLNTTVIEITSDKNREGNEYRNKGNAAYGEPSSVIAESQKTPSWYYRKLRYFLTYYNNPVGGVSFGAGVNAGNKNISNDEVYYPVQRMIRMCMYYLGKQPNLDNAWMVQDAKNNSLQSQWLKGQNVSEFVNYFRGLILQRLNNATFNAKSMNRDAINAKTEAVEKLQIKQELDKVLSPLFQEVGIAFNPVPNANPMAQTKEDIENEVDKNFYDANQEIYRLLANGVYFTNGWYTRLVQCFMHTVITGLGYYEHYVEKGKVLQRVVMPWQVVEDNRIDDDFGRMDKFRGKIEQLTITDVAIRFPNLSKEQLEDLERTSTDGKLSEYYNTTITNLVWYGTNNNRQNTITCVTMYWRDLHYGGKVLADNKYGSKTVRKTKEGEQGYSTEDLYQCTVLGDKYIVNYGLSDNVIEDLSTGRPSFPIYKFKPSVFLGENVSEVGRIYKIQDELDMLDYKIRDMVGKAKGKVYIVQGDKLPEGTDGAELIENLSNIGLQVTNPSGVSGDNSTIKDMVSAIDMTLDPNIVRLVELYKDREARMGRIMSTSPVSLGQEYKYVGLGQAKSTIAQNTLGVAYILDGFLDFVVMNMRYATNLQKILSANDEKNNDLMMLLGDSGVRYLKFTKDMQWEQMYIELIINDSMSDQDKKEIEQVSLAWAQNSVLTPLTWLKIKRSESYTKAIAILEKETAENEAKMQKQQQEQQAMTIQQIEVDKNKDLEVVQYKEMMENYRKELDAAVKLLGNYQQAIQQVQPVQPLVEPQQPQPSQQELPQEDPMQGLPAF